MTLKAQKIRPEALPVEPVPPAQVIRRRLESQLHLKALAGKFGRQEPRVELLQLPANLQARTRPIAPANNRVADRDPRQTIEALVPSGMPAFLTGTLQAKHTLLIDCRALHAGQIREIWYSWPEDITAAEVACVLIASDPECLVLANDGACLELIPQDNANGSPAEKYVTQSRMDFVKRKYGVEKLIKAEAYFRL